MLGYAWQPHKGSSSVISHLSIRLRQKKIKMCGKTTSELFSQLILVREWIWAKTPHFCLLSWGQQTTVGFSDNQLKEKVIQTPERTAVMCRRRAEQGHTRNVHKQGKTWVWCLGELTGLFWLILHNTSWPAVYITLYQVLNIVFIYVCFIYIVYMVYT